MQPTQGYSSLQVQLGHLALFLTIWSVSDQIANATLEYHLFRSLDICEF